MPIYRADQNYFRVTVLCIAMAFLESAVVIYLRELYYPAGFSFPLVLLPPRLALTEFLRELATLIMLLSIAALAGSKFRQRFSWFIYSFAIWDIFYYVFLKLMINWPDSWFTWDILFLIPVIWTGPVIAPVISSGTMILLAVIILHFDFKRPENTIRWPIILAIITGAILIFLSFIWDYSCFMLHHESFPAMFRSGIAEKTLGQYIPASFNWGLFLAGESAEIASIVLLMKDTRKTGTAR